MIATNWDNNDNSSTATFNKWQGHTIIAEGTCETYYEDAISDDKVLKMYEASLRHLIRWGARIAYKRIARFDAYFLTFLYWTNLPIKQLMPQTIQKPSISGYYSGTIPRNRGRHFDRKVYWRR